MLSEGVKKGLEAYIIREDGTRFPEHQIVHTDGNNNESSTTSCFLESTEGSMFTIVIEVRGAVIYHPTRDWIMKVSVDGRQIKTSVRRRNDPWTVKVSNMVSLDNGKLVEGKLVFAKLRTTDDDANVTLHSSELCSVGQISISFERGIVGKGTGQLHRRAVVQPEVGIASERGKKLGGAIGSTSQVPYADKSKGVTFVSHDKAKPFHRMIFNYRTTPVLELMRVIEAPEPIIPAAQAGSSKKRKRSTTSKDIKPDQKAVLAARVKQLERQLREVAPLPRARVPAKVIDLTGEDPDEA